jgi:hypothetical protein
MSKIKSIAAEQVDCGHMEADEGLPPLCENCGYNLTGLMGHICPECGRPFNSNAPYISRIPWARRHEIGRCRAYFFTVIELLFRPATFVRESMGGSSRAVADSESFRAVTLWIAAVSGGLGLAGIISSVLPERPLAVFLVLSPVMMLFCWTYLLIASQVVQDIRLFSRDNVPRPMGRVMLRYTCGALALTPLVMLGLNLLLRLQSWSFSLSNQSGITFLFFFLLAALALPLFWWLVAYRIASGITGGAVQTLVEMLFFVPLGWGVVSFFWCILFIAPTFALVTLFVDF